MPRRYTDIEITVSASYRGPEYVPEECTASETSALQVPIMDEKYVDLPKPVQGLLLQVYASHRGKVADHFVKIEKEKQKADAARRERERLALWNQEPDEEEDEDTGHINHVIEFESPEQAVEQLGAAIKAITGEEPDNPFEDEE